MTDQNETAKDDEKGFFGELFDFSFKTWVTLRVAGVLYAITLAIIILFALAVLFALFRTGDILALLVALAVPLVTFLVILLVRLLFESAVATVAIAKNTTPR